jgi:hypothetical protein
MYAHLLNKLWCWWINERFLTTITTLNTTTTMLDWNSSAWWRQKFMFSLQPLNCLLAIPPQKQPPKCKFIHIFFSQIGIKCWAWLNYTYHQEGFFIGSSREKKRNQHPPSTREKKINLVEFRFNKIFKIFFLLFMTLDRILPTLTIFNRKNRSFSMIVLVILEKISWII